VDDQVLKSVKEFKYLGSPITEGNIIAMEIKQGIVMAN
jgi:hypothetical protein